MSAFAASASAGFIQLRSSLVPASLTYAKYTTQFCDFDVTPAAAEQ